MLSQTDRTVICLKCLGKARLKCNGPCPCRIDGKDILEHILGGQCPLEKYSGEPIKPEPLKPIPRDRWPAWAKAVALLSDDTDIGIGDTIHRQLGKLGEAYKTTLEILGVPCACDKRREEFNAVFPY